MYEDRIVIDPAVKHGKPIIKGTRVPLEIILGSLAGGMDIVEIVREYDLQKEDALPALAYAARLIAGEGLQPIRKAKNSCSMSMNSDRTRKLLWVNPFR